MVASRFSFRLLTLTASVLMLAMSAGILGLYYQNGMKDLHNTVANTAVLAANHFDAHLSQTEALLLSASQRLHGINTRDEQSLEKLREQLAIDVASIPIVIRLGITDAAGFQILNTGKPNVRSEGMTLSDRQYFKDALAGQEGFIYTGPVQARLDGTWSLVLSKRYNDRQGRFKGVVFAVIPTDRLGLGLGQIDLGVGTTYNIRTLELAQVVRYPALSGANQGTGNRNVSSTVQRILAENPGIDRFTYSTVAPIDNTRRVYAYQRFPNAPLWMTVGLGVDSFYFKCQSIAGGLFLLWLTATVALYYMARRLDSEGVRLQSLVAQRTDMLHAQGQRLQDIVDATRIGTWVWNIPNDSLYVNTYWRELTRYANDQDIMPVGSLWIRSLGENSDNAQRQIARHLAGEQDRIDFEIAIDPGQDNTIWLRVCGRVINSDDNGSPRDVAGTVENITDRKRIADALLVDYSVLHTQQQTLNSILKAAPIAVRIINDMNGCLLFSNQAFDALVDADANAPERYKDEAIFADREQFSRFRALLAQGKSVLNELVALKPKNDASAVVTWVVASYMTIQYEDQKATLTWFVDVSEIYRARDLALAQTEAKSRFLSNMSHEIRTPLNTIISMGYLLEEWKLDDDQKTVIDTIASSGKILLHLVNDILDVAKIEAGEIQFESVDFSLTGLVSEITKLFEIEVSAKALSFSSQIDPVLNKARFVGDIQKLRQMLINLVGNAVKFTENGGIHLAVTVQDQQTNPAVVRFEVKDTGIGIAAQDMQHIFDPFVQADSGVARQFGGTGLGLNLVKQFAELMGGRVGGESELGTGSTFWFEIPLHRMDQATKALSGPEDRSSRMPFVENDLVGVHWLSGMRILVVDDSALNRNVCGRLLASQGAQVEYAGSGQESVNLLLQRPKAFDLILMDIQMPIMDGFEAARRILSAAEPTTADIIALTAGATVSEREQAFAAGMVDYLTKPIDRLLLVRTLRNHYGKSHFGMMPAPVQPTDLQLENTENNTLWSTVPVLDTTQLRKCIGDDLTMFRQLVGDFIGESTDLLASLGVDGACGDERAIHKALHKLKGQAANLGADQLVNLCRVAEESEQYDSDPDRERLCAVRRALTSLVRDLDAWRSKYDAAPSEETPNIQGEESENLRGLIEMLDGHDMSAVEVYASLSHWFDQHMDPVHKSQLATAIERLDFEAAAELINMILTSSKLSGNHPSIQSH